MYDADDCCPAPHAWAIVDGHQVDLVGELYGWRLCGDDVWGYEPLKEFTHEELISFAKDYQGFDSFPLTHHMWEADESTDADYPYHVRTTRAFELPGLLGSTPAQRATIWRKWVAEHDDERCAYATNFVFKPAIDRLLERLNAAKAVAA